MSVRRSVGPSVRRSGRGKTSGDTKGNGRYLNSASLKKKREIIEKEKEREGKGETEGERQKDRVSDRHYNIGKQKNE